MAVFRSTLIAFIALALVSQTVYCQDDEDGGYGGGEPDDEYGGGGGGGGGEEEEPPAPSEQTKELTSIEDFESFLDDNDASVIGAFTAAKILDPDAKKPDDWDDDEDGEWEAATIDNPALVSFNSISSNAYNYRFAYTTTPEVLEKLKAKAGGLYLYKSPRFASKEHGDRPRERYGSPTLTESGVLNWLSAKAQPLVGLFSSGTKERYAGVGKPPVLVIFMPLDFEKNAKGVNYVLKRARKAAKAHAGKLAFALASVSDMSYELADYGLTSSKPNTDILMGILQRKAGTDTYYGDESEQKFSAATMEAFASKFLAGELTPHVKPDPPPYEPPADEDGETPDETDEDEPDADKEEM